MKVRLLISRAGYGFSQSAGDGVDVPDAEGARLIEAGKAEPVRSAKKETATRKQRVERAVSE